MQKDGRMNEQYVHTAAFDAVILFVNLMSQLLHLREQNKMTITRKLKHSQL